MQTQKATLFQPIIYLVDAALNMALLVCFNAPIALRICLGLCAIGFLTAAIISFRRYIKAKNNRTDGSELQDNG